MPSPSLSGPADRDQGPTRAFKLPVTVANALGRRAFGRPCGRLDPRICSGSGSGGWGRGCSNGGNAPGGPRGRSGWTSRRRRRRTCGRKSGRYRSGGERGARRKGGKGEAGTEKNGEGGAGTGGVRRVSRWRRAAPPPFITSSLSPLVSFCISLCRLIPFFQAASLREQTGVSNVAVAYWEAERKVNGHRQR